MQGSTYDPQNVGDFEKGKLNFAGKSCLGTSNAGETTNVDILLADDMLMTGGILIVKGGKMLDQISLQIVHPTYGVVNEFVTNYHVIEDSNRQFELLLQYPAKLATGLTIRCKFTSSADVGTRTIAINYLLHKILL